MLNLHIIIASTRPGRAGLPIAKWAYDRAAAHPAFNSKLIDLAEINLPFLDEPNHPRKQDYQHQHTKDWSATIAAADAFVIVTPEYNFSAPAPLVNAFDYLYVEWGYKPLCFVSYGGVSGGTRSVQMTKQLVTTVKMMPIPEAVSIPMFAQYLKEGVFSPPEHQAKAANAMLDELARWAIALKPLRAG